ncbi:MAG: alpha/beta fold hydrolase [Actinomycetota bacterium]|nr:alpha/beta fold hydrolase [Actinomycetota bacterium]
MNEPVRVTSADGLALEGCLDSPDDPAGAVVFCHPHPKMGGTMNAPLLLAVTEELVERGWAVLRFNFRGIGASEGEASTGIAEVADGGGGISFVSERLPNLPIAIAGWSFGGAVALRAAAKHPEVVACVAIAPAVMPKPDITAGAPAPELFTFRGPTLLICGANDDQVSPQACRSWAEDAGARYEEMRGANHFFWGKYETLAAKVAEFLDEAV